MRQTLRIMLVAVAAGLLCSTGAQAKKPDNSGGGGGSTPAYTIVPFLPPGSTSAASYVSDINEQGQVVGKLEYASGVDEAIHLDLATGKYTTLSGATFALGINNGNEIVGSDWISALFWSSPSAAPILLPPLTGDSVSWANGINDAGIVIGESASVVGGDYLSVPVVWRVYVDDNQTLQVDGPKGLPPLNSDSHAAWDINELVADAAQVSGESDSEAVIWTIRLNADGTLADLEAPRGLGTLAEPDSYWSEGRGISNFGDVCGQSGILPFVVPAGQEPVPLSVPRQTLNGGALDMNDSGEIVGSIRVQQKGNFVGPGTEYAFLWKDGERIDLTQQISTDSGWDRLCNAWVVNNSGVIGGSGILDNEFRGFILIPNGP